MQINHRAAATGAPELGAQSFGGRFVGEREM
jgi:hypothetical protein